MRVLISSYSNSYDIWHITHHFYNKFWKNDNIKVYLGANGENNLEYCPKDWIYINKGKDESFSKSLISYLEEIEDEYFILMLDDFMILEKVDNNLIQKAFEFIKNNKGVYLRLTPNPKGDYKINEYFSKIDVLSRVPYITSLQMAIWKKDFLIDLLKYDFSPWEFEIKAGKTKEALQHSDKFYVTNFDFIKYTHFVEKGKFYPFIKKYLKQENLEFIGNREFFDNSELFKSSVIKDRIRNLVPNKFVNKIRKFLGRHEL